MDRVTTYNYTGFDASTGNGIVTWAILTATPRSTTMSLAPWSPSGLTGAIGSTLVSENDDVPKLTAVGPDGWFTAHRIDHERRP